MEQRDINAVRAYYRVKRGGALGLDGQLGRRWFVTTADDGSGLEEWRRIVCKLDGYENQAAALYAMEQRIQDQIGWGEGDYEDWLASQSPFACGAEAAPAHGGDADARP